MSATEATTVLKTRFPGAIDRASADHPAVALPAADIPAALKCLRDEFAFDMLSDLTAIDWSQAASPRFTVVYHLLSTTTHDYIRVTADCPSDAEPSVPSVTSLWPGANWHEREVFDMFGIGFAGHPDLRRILMWDGYPHHPLRKEFPLAGIDAPLSDAAVAAETNVNLIPAPMAGGPFVASAGEMNLGAAEPEAKDESWNEGKPKPE